MMDKLELGDLVTFTESGEIGIVVLVELRDDFSWGLTASVKWLSDNDVTRENAYDPDGIAIIARASGV